MKRDALATSVDSVPKQRAASASVMYILADTTWRVAVPTLLFAGLGMFLDVTFHMAPLFTLIGLVLGLFAAGVLVWKQIKLATNSGGRD